MLDINNLPQVRTVEQLRSAMELLSPMPVPDDRLWWFVCVREAESVNDMTNREVARLFLDGIIPINTLEQVQEYIDITLGDAEAYHEENNRCLLAQVASFCGNHDLANELLGVDNG